MKRYIEVIGEGRFVETAVRFIAEIVLEVRASKDETAFREVGELAAEAVSILNDAGFEDDEIIEGGLNAGRTWYWKKHVGQTASRKIILKVSDFPKLERGLASLEPLQSRNKERRTVSVAMMQPEFDDCGNGKTQALAAAFVEAKAKASRLAEVMGCRLGRPLRVEEGATAKRNSGFSGDEDWGGDYGRFATGGGVMLAFAGAAGEAEAAPELPRPTRTLFV